MTYQDKISQQVFHGNAAFGATTTVTSRVLGWQECTPDNGGSVKKLYLKSEDNTCKIVGKYTRKSKRQSWDETVMSLAIKAINAEEMEWQLSLKMFVVPQATLGRQVTNIHGANKGLGHFRATLDETLEHELVANLKCLESVCMA